MMNVVRNFTLEMDAMNFNSLSDFNYCMSSKQESEESENSSAAAANAMIEMIRERFQRNCAYMRNGTRTLISLKIVDESIVESSVLNDQRAKSEWANKTHDCSSAHLYTFAKVVVRNCAIYKRPSYVLFTGCCSASGKTKSCYEFMNTISSGNVTVEDVFRFRLTLLRADLLIQTFGSVQNEKCANANCFGKCVQLYFDGEGALKKMAFNTFLLDATKCLKSGSFTAMGYFRLAMFSSVRKHHLLAVENSCINSFYFFVFGNTELSLNQRFGLSDVVRTFSASGKVAQREAHKDGFRRLVVALKTLNFSENACNALWSCLASVLHLMKFTQNDSTNVATTAATLHSDGQETFDCIWWIASLLSVPLSDLNGIFERYANSRFNQLDRSGKPIEQSYVRTVFASNIYERLFYWLTRCINQTFEDLTADACCVSSNNLMLIDIPLMNFSGSNSFQALCLNFLNEKLHQMYVKSELVELQSLLYAEMEKKWKWIELEEKGARIFDLFEDARNGLINFFVSSSPTNDAKTFVQRVEQECSRNSDNFMIEHFKTLVIYRFEDVVFDDDESVAGAVEYLMKRSSNEHIRQMWTTMAAADCTNKSSSKGQRMFPSLYFVNDQLFSALRQRDAYYVRCIDCCVDGRNQFDPKKTLDQLLAYNIYEHALLLDKSKIVRTESNENFVRRYKMIAAVRDELFVEKKKRSSTVRECALKIIVASGLQNLIYVGNSHVFYKDEQAFYTLEGSRACDMEYVVIIVQSAFRAWYQKKLTLKHEAATVLAKWYRARKIHQYFSNIFLNNQQAAWKSLPETENSCAQVRTMIELREIGVSILRKRKNFLRTSFSQVWLGNYLEHVSNETAFLFTKRMQVLRDEDQWSEIVFASNAIKMNSHGSENYRSIIITDTLIYKLDPNKKYAVKKQPIPLHQFTALNITSEADQLVVMQSSSSSTQKTHDLVFYIDCEPLGGDRVCELACLLFDLYSRKKLSFAVNVVSSLSSRFERDAYTLNIAAGDKVTFKRNGTMNVVTVTSPHSFSKNIIK